jgi:hypothetical protein
LSSVTPDGVDVEAGAPDADPLKPTPGWLLDFADGATVQPGALFDAQPISATTARHMTTARPTDFIERTSQRQPEQSTRLTVVASPAARMGHVAQSAGAEWLELQESSVGCLLLAT